MKLQKKEFLRVNTGQFTNGEGQNQYIYRTIGELLTFEQDDGTTSQSVNLYHMPEKRIYVSEPKQNNSGSGQDNSGTQQNYTGYTPQQNNSSFPQGGNQTSNADQNQPGFIPF